MINVLKTTFKVDMAYAINSFIYIIKKVPIIRILVSDKFYSSVFLKRFVQILGIILTSFRLILYRLIYFGCIYLFSSFVSKRLGLAFIHIYILFALIGLIMNTNLLSVSNKKYISIILFQMDAKKYLCSDFLWGLVLSFILNLIGFSVFSFIKIPLYVVICLCLFSSLCRIVGEGLSIYFYKRNGYLLINKYSFTFSYMFILLGLCFLPLLDIFINNSLFIILVIIGLLAVFSFIYIMSVNDYKLIYKRINTASAVMSSNNSDAYTRQKMVEIKDKDKLIDNKKIEGKNGYDLFNTIFFERHKEILLRSAKTYSLVSAVVITCIIVVLILFSDVFSGFNAFLHTNLGWLVLLMYFINRGAIVTQAMFYNCDHAMLTYNFYREPNILLKLFEKRLIMLVKVNLLPAVVIAIGFIFLLYFSGGTIFINYITIPLFIILLSIFFSVHYLVIYYLLQPYNKNLEMKKASYSIVSGLTYFISYIFTDIEMSSLLLSVVGLGFTIVYVIVSLILVYRFAPRTFKINN